MSKISSMSRLHAFKSRTNSHSKMMKDINSKSMSDFLESSPEPHAKMPNLTSQCKAPTFMENQQDGIQVSINPITG